MKGHELKRQLRSLGWWDSKKGTKHAKYTDGIHHVAVPRHEEINGKTAYKIIKQATTYSQYGLIN